MTKSAIKNIVKFKRNTFFTGHAIILIYLQGTLVGAKYSDKGMSKIMEYEAGDTEWDEFSMLHFDTFNKAFKVLDMIEMKLSLSK